VPTSGVDHPEEVVVDADPGRPVNINIRPVTAPVWRETLLFRDWLRSHDAERDAYAVMKRRLTQRPGNDVDDYGRDKMPWISAALGRAEDWAAAARWSP
jgi:dephospho-CoA kinase